MVNSAAPRLHASAGSSNLHLSGIGPLPDNPHPMKKLLLLAVLALSPAAFAQDNAAKLALAREAISAMKIDQMFDGMAAQMKQGALQMVQLPDSATPEQKQKFDRYMDKVMDLSMSQVKTMIAKMDTVYASVYSETELKAMVAFFKSPEGQSMIAKQPQVMASIMPLVQGMQQELGPKMQQLTEEFKRDLEAPAATPAAAN